MRDLEAECELMRQRFIRTVRVENKLINIYAGKEPIPTDKQWFFDLAKEIGIPEDYNND